MRWRHSISGRGLSADLLLVVRSQFANHLVPVDALHRIDERSLRAVFGLVDEKSETLGLPSVLVKP